MPSSVHIIHITDPTAPKPNPVNPLGAHTRLHLSRSLRSALADGAVTSIILTGGGGANAGRNFSAGADIREFSLPASEVTSATTIDDEDWPAGCSAAAAAAGRTDTP
jgi:enoyl-CoA hydratase/carnithine racemase